MRILILETSMAKNIEYDISNITKDINQYKNINTIQNFVDS